MYNILIPTDFSGNTINAMYTVQKLIQNNPSRIILLYSIPLPDSITEMLFLPSYTGPDSSFQEEIDKILESHEGGIKSIEVLCQYGMSSSIIEQILQTHSIDFSVVPICNGKAGKVHKEVIISLKGSSTPTLFLPDVCHVQEEAKIAVLRDEPTRLPEMYNGIARLLDASVYTFYKLNNGFTLKEQVMSHSQVSDFIEQTGINIMIYIKKQSFWERNFAQKLIPSLYPEKVVLPFISLTYN